MCASDAARNTCRLSGTVQLALLKMVGAYKNVPALGLSFGTELT